MSDLEAKEILRDDDIIKTDEGLIFNPYNPLNVKITLSEVQSILSKYGLPTTIDNIALYERAFVHRSYTKRPNFENVQQNITIVERPSDCMPLSSKSNERLEFLGDGVLECVTKYLLYRRFPKADGGFMTEKKIAIVKNEAIGKIALEMGLHQWLIISKHAEERGVSHHDVNDELFEAILSRRLEVLSLASDAESIPDHNSHAEDAGTLLEMLEQFLIDGQNHSPSR